MNNNNNNNNNNKGRLLIKLIKKSSAKCRYVNKKLIEAILGSLPQSNLTVLQQHLQHPASLEWTMQIQPRLQS